MSKREACHDMESSTISTVFTCKRKTCDDQLFTTGSVNTCTTTVGNGNKKAAGKSKSRRETQKDKLINLLLTSKSSSALGSSKLTVCAGLELSTDSLPVSRKRLLLKLLKIPHDKAIVEELLRYLLETGKWEEELETKYHFNEDSIVKCFNLVFKHLNKGQGEILPADNIETIQAIKGWTLLKRQQEFGNKHRVESKLLTEAGVDWDREMQIRSEMAAMSHP